MARGEIVLREANLEASFTGTHTDYGRPMSFTACYSLWLIRLAWDGGCDFEDLANGYGSGMGTHGDWSGIRDSSDEAVMRMLERALNFIRVKVVT